MINLKRGILSEERMSAHEAFDVLWKGPEAHMRRKAAYEWLVRKMGISPEFCHIGLFNVQQCRLVVQICNEYMEWHRQHVKSSINE